MQRPYSTVEMKVQRKMDHFVIIPCTCSSEAQRHTQGLVLFSVLMHSHLKPNYRQGACRSQCVDDNCLSLTCSSRGQLAVRHQAILLHQSLVLSPMRVATEIIAFIYFSIAARQLASVLGRLHVILCCHCSRSNRKGIINSC